MIIILMGRFELRFDTIESRYETSQLQAFLLAHPGDYDTSSYVPWVNDTCIPDVRNGRRLAFGWWQYGSLVSDAVVRAEGQDVALLRHFRVEAPDFANRGLGSFALRQVFPVAVEILNQQDLISRDANSITIRLDTRSGSSAEAFFEHNGFRVLHTDELYTPGLSDVVMERGFAL